MIAPQLPDPMAEHTKLKHVKENKFQIIATGYGSHNEYAIYEFDETGRINNSKHEKTTLIQWMNGRLICWS
jgi:hypothetical protein